MQLAELDALPLLLESVGLLSECPSREQITALADMLDPLEAVHGVVDIHTMHHVHGGLYGRSVVIKAGTLVVGAVHKIPGFARCVGDLTSWTERGRERFTGAHLIESVPGPRVVFAHADTTWFTVHPNLTGDTDVAAIEAAIVETPNRLMSRRTTTQLMLVAA